MAQQVRLLLTGVGNLGRRFLELLIDKEELLREPLGLELTVVGVADTSGAAICSTGLDLEATVRLKTEGHGVARYRHGGRPGFSALEMVQTTEADLLLEASPVNLEHGQPGLGCIEAALSRGMHVVTGNKAPLVLAFPRLQALARKQNVRLRFDATVAGGLPAVNLGQRDLATAEIYRLEGILNLTANYILALMAEEGLSYEEALVHAQAAGHAETDIRLDVEGWDAANKLVILANSVLRYPATLADVSVVGITRVTPDRLAQATLDGKRIKLMATAEREGRGYKLSVHPRWLDADHPMARLGPEQMGIVYHTDTCGVIAATILEETPMPTASAMLRDVVHIYSD